MANDNRPGGEEQDWIDPHRQQGSVTDDADSYSGQAYTPDKEAALGERLPSGSVTSDPQAAIDPDSDAAAATTQAELDAEKQASKLGDFA